MSTETLETGVIDKDPSSLEAFFERHKQSIDLVIEQFNSDNYAEFKKLAAAISSLCSTYEAETKDTFTNIFEEVLHKIVGEGYIIEREKNLRALPERDGMYEPADDAGGGDFWEKHEYGGNVGEVGADAELVDVVGHGEKTLYKKALVQRFLELYHAQPKELQTTLFTDLDQFLSVLPDVQVVDLIDARITQAGEHMVLETEIAGSAVLFFRDNETGMIYQRIPNGKHYADNAQDIFTPVALDEYMLIGTGANTPGERRVNRIDLPPNVDVYILSDGLFELPTDPDANRANGLFEHQFAQFCRDHKGASGDEFRAALLEKAHELKKMFVENNSGEKVDDITVLVLHVADNKVS